MTPTRHKRPGWESEILKSAKPGALTGGIRTWTWEPKANDAQPHLARTVLLIHGWDGRGSQLGRLVEPLLAAGFRVVTWDGPAHGDSAGARTHLPETAAKLKEFAKSEGTVHAIIAHSFGAGCSAFAVHQGLPVERLVLVASPSSIQGVFDRFTEWAKLRPQARQIFQEDLEALTGYRVRELEISAFDWKSPSPPTLVVHAPEDPDVPFAEAEQIVARWPRARLLSSPGLGHRRILKDPGVISEIVSFCKLGHDPAPESSRTSTV